MEKIIAKMKAVTDAGDALNETLIAQGYDEDAVFIILDACRNDAVLPMLRAFLDAKGNL